RFDVRLVGVGNGNGTLQAPATDATIRLIDSSSTIETLETADLEPALFAVIGQTLDMASGVLIVNGPTGSGKSTMMQRMIDRVNKPTKKIVALEDPIEKL